MESNLTKRGMIPGGVSYGGVDLQGSMGVHHQGQYSLNLCQENHNRSHQRSSVRSLVRGSSPLTMGSSQHCNHRARLVDCGKGDIKNSVSDEDEPSFSEEGIDGAGKNALPWQRVKWTDKMVKLLITVISYMGDDSASGCGGLGRRRLAVLQKKGKWKSVSKIMAERGYHVSPQQCEDKFNDLNKRYKRLNDMLGRGTSCQVVDNPALLDGIDYLTAKEKDEVRKILSSKHLFYQEMCSYHNGNRLHLPHDPELLHSLQLVLRNRIDCENDDLRKLGHEDFDEDECDMETDARGDFEENRASHENNRGLSGTTGGCMKRVRQGLGYEEGNLMHSLTSNDYNNRSHCQAEAVRVGTNHVLPETRRIFQLQKLWIESRSLQLEEKRLQIQTDRLELEKQRFKWERFNKKRDRELEKLKLENERMKLENEQMASQLKQKGKGGASLK
ncbi:uncharacterized protein LOC111021176 [Momordica charantia]|uniref:Uncharacterized protein LOC111021176 n=1 Tax=Momordica charantia TaxID=3673 RepID=A0A6J1DI82_MOMCH|nr:uncharacterized protein LOC111021176 [Momordica charantia]